MAEYKWIDQDKKIVEEITEVTRMIYYEQLSPQIDEWQENIDIMNQKRDFIISKKAAIKAALNIKEQ